MKALHVITRLKRYNKAIILIDDRGEEVKTFPAKTHAHELLTWCADNKVIFDVTCNIDRGKIAAVENAMCAC